MGQGGEPAKSTLFDKTQLPPCPRPAKRKLLEETPSSPTSCRASTLFANETGPRRPRLSRSIKRQRCSLSPFPDGFWHPVPSKENTSTISTIQSSPVLLLGVFSSSTLTIYISDLATPIPTPYKHQRLYNHLFQSAAVCAVAPAAHEAHPRPDINTLRRARPAQLIHATIDLL